jgi:hypothetical protein
MTLNSTFKTLAVAMLLLLTTSMTYASEWSGHISGLLGLKTLDSNDWPDMETHFSMGLAFDIKEDSWPISIALDVMDSGGMHRHDGMKDLGHTTEGHFGMRKIFVNKSSKIQPYIGGGVAFISAEQEYEEDNNKIKQDDNGVGGWLGAGMYYTIHPRFVLGLDVRYSHAEVTLFDQDRAAGGLHTFATVGIQF